MVAGLVFCTAGIAGFLAVAHPSGGRTTVSLAAGLPLMAGLAAVLACCLLAAHWGPRQVRPLWLALACGVDFGVTAFLLKLVPDTLPEGFGDPARQWPLYLLVIVGPTGFLLNQNAFQACLLISPVLAIITTADPLVSIGIAHFWLKETMASTPPALAAEAVSLALMAGGIYALAHRAPHVARQLAGRPVRAGHAGLRSRPVARTTVRSAEGFSEFSRTGRGASPRHPLPLTRPIARLV